MARTKTVTVGGTDYQLQSVTYSWYSNLTDLYINPANGRKNTAKYVDALIKGFDKQLDDLYRNEAMDIDSDIRVMENMLRRDTASVEDDFGLDGAAVQRAPDEE